MEELIPIVAILTSATMVVLVVLFVTRARSRRVEAQVEMQSRLIDRFGSAPELINFLQSPAGRQFVTGVQGASTILTRERIMSGFTRSVITTMLGAAFLFLTYYEGDRGFAIPAAILFFLGIGYFIATFITWKLAHKINGIDADSNVFGGTDISRT